VVTSLSRPGRVNCDVEGTQDSSQSSDDTIEDVSTPTLHNSPDTLQSRSKFDSSVPLVFAVEPGDAGPSSGTDKQYVTSRFSYLPSGDKDAFTVPPNGQKIFRCEDEPIHIPGAIQRYGALIAI
jgi:hypothetical protein